MDLTLSAHVTMTPTDRGMVLLDERTGRYWTMNNTGATVLRALLTGSDTASIVADLRTTYPAATDHVAADVTALLRALDDAGLVTR
ncbi:lasso peptide biosynthesis PqqD family chaperone [Saccharothrix sp. AJ9571]|nr:lasso peptide biosynthesis PqqD family chaperone [Saccharothrix sp. AJ9571]